MIGNLIIDKASSNMSYFLYSIKILHEHSGCISRKEFVETMAAFVGKPPYIGGRENRTLYNKSNFPRYFGFIDLSKDDAGNEVLVLTKRGVRLAGLISERPDHQNAERQYWVKPEKQPAFVKLLIDSVVFDTFGRNNSGVKTSSSDVEPPKILFKTLDLLGRATADELYYIFYSLDNGVHRTYSDAINTVKANRARGEYDYSNILEQWGQTTNVADCKIIKIFADDSINLILSERDDVIGKTFYKLNPHTTQNYREEIKCLSPVYAPIQMAVHSARINAAEQWVSETVLSRVGSTSCITAFDHSADNTSLAFIQDILIPAVAKAYSNEKANHYLVIQNADTDQVAQLFGKLAPLLVRKIDFTSVDNGFSSNAVADEEIYKQLVALSGNAKKRLKKPEVLLPPNFHIVSIGSENSNMSREYDYTFKHCLIEADSDVNATAFDYAATAGAGENKIFFGTPGCGKSYYIDHELLGKDKDTKKYTGDYHKDNIIRTTFYQDYSNTDFVGQILPRVMKGNGEEKDTVEYSFNPGPFTLALIQAISNPDEKVALVVEEINRGNAPAIFGDIFQLLDRGNDGISEYGIVNVSLMDYLHGHRFIVNGQVKRYTFKEIKIPGNLDIFATMNTSDQNVYTLDTAFVRRWEKVKVKNDFSKCAFRGRNVPGMEYTWEEFADAINTWIASSLEDLQVNEDKQLGVFFVKESLLASGDAEKFAYKVFDYLWNDVTKLDHGMLFDDQFKTLDQLIAAYAKTSVKVFKNPNMFKKLTVP